MTDVRLNVPFLSRCKKICVSPGDSNHSARHHSNQVVFNREEGSVRTSVAERNPEPLGAPQCDVNPKLSRRTQHAESQQIGGAASQSLETNRGQTTSGRRRPTTFKLSLVLTHKDVLPLPCVRGQRGRCSLPPCHPCRDTGRARRSRLSH